MNSHIHYFLALSFNHSSTIIPNVKVNWILFCGHWLRIIACIVLNIHASTYVKMWICHWAAMQDELTQQEFQDYDQESLENDDQIHQVPFGRGGVNASVVCPGRHRTNVTNFTAA